MPDSINTVADLVDALPPASPVAPPAEKAKPQRVSITVRKLGEELYNALRIREALREHADDEQLILDTIEGQTDLAEACCAVYEETLEDQILLAGLKAKIDDLGERKSRIERTIETRRTMILQALDKAGIDTVSGPLATLTRSKVAPAVVIDQEDQIPSKFWKKADPTLDRKALKAALEADEAVPGAKLGNEGVTLTIRVK